MALDPVILGAGFGLLALLAILVFAVDDGTARATRRRLERVGAASHRPRTGGAEPAVTIRRDSVFSRNPLADGLIRRFVPRAEKLKGRLAQAGLGLTIGQLLGLCAGLAGVAILVSRFAAAQAWPAALSLGVLAGIALPWLLTAWFARRRRNRFIASFPEAIDLMVRGIKSGLPITETIRVVADEVPDPVGGEFRQVMDAVTFGKKLDQALWDTTRRLDLPEFKFFTVSLAIQAETGGNLAETLANLSDVLRKRRQVKLKVKALSAEPKTSAYIIGALPFIMSAIIYLMNPDYLMGLFDDPRGTLMMAAGGVFFAVGIAVMARMVRFEI